MHSILYIPIEKNKVSSEFKNRITNWLKNQKQDTVTVTYRGEKGFENLLKDTNDAKIYVLAPGKVKLPHPAIGALPIETALGFEDTSRQFKLYENEKSFISVPQIAKDMIKDGLFNTADSYTLRIKLFFFDARKQATRLASAFHHVLTQNPEHAKHNVRIDYYHATHSIQGPIKTNETDSPHKHVISESLEPTVRTQDIRKSLSNRPEIVPKLSLSLKLAKIVLADYNDAQSSRFFGLSKLLGLNSFFSMDTDFQIALKTEKSDEKRFEMAEQFTKKFPHHALTPLLIPVLDSIGKGSNKKFRHANSIEQPMDNQHGIIPKLPLSSKLAESLIKMAKTVVEKHNLYQSSRLFGLSNVLGLNRFFSSSANIASNTTIQAIKALMAEKSDEKRFELAKRFTELFPEDPLSHDLIPRLKAAQKASFVELMQPSPTDEKPSSTALSC